MGYFENDEKIVDKEQLIFLRDKMQKVLCDFIHTVHCTSSTPRRFLTIHKRSLYSVNNLEIEDMARLIHICFVRAVCYRGFRKDKRDYVYTYCTLIMRKLLRKYEVETLFKQYSVEVVGMLRYSLTQMCLLYKNLET